MARGKTKAIKRDKVLINIVPLIISITFFVLAIIFFKEESIPAVDRGTSMVETMLGIWGTFLGFLITAVSILLTLGSGKFIDMLKNTGHFSTVLETFLSCCFHLFVVIVVFIVCTFGTLWSKFWFVLICACTMDSFIMILLCLYFLYMIVKRANEK